MKTMHISAIPGRRPFGKAHILQSGLAAVYILVMFLIMNALESRMAVASLGASTFIAFTFPHTQSARARILIGGYCVGGIWGIVWAGVIYLIEAAVTLPFPAYVPGCALAVFCSMLSMTALNFEHPPSAALTAAVVCSATPVALGLAAVVCIIILCAVKHLLRNHLVNL